MSSYLDFYERVKFLAKKNKTTVEYVVGRAGLKLKTYNSYRRYKNLPRADEALTIAQVLGTSVEYLVGGSNPKPATADELLSDIAIMINRYNKSVAKNGATKAK
jgi:transcriptional regulator with XRE-family HTH domain